jgi:predicted negative regulator of RcsB-dependent stress response
MAEEQKPEPVGEEPRPPEAAEPVEAAPETTDLVAMLKEYGKTAGIAVAVAALAYVGFSYYRSRRDRDAADAAALLERARTPEQLEAVVRQYGGTASGPVASLALAAEHFHAGRYDQAAAEYDRFLKAHADHPFRAAAELNRIQCDEAAGRTAEAMARFEAFAAAHPAHVLQPLALLGKGRCLEALGRLDDARTVYEDFMAANPESGWVPQAEAALTFVRQRLRAQKTGTPTTAPTAAPVVVTLPAPAPPAPVPSPLPAPPAP